MADPDGPARPLPLPDPDTAFYWEAARRHELRILRCDACGLYVHPPKPSCRACGEAALHPEPVSGRGSIHSYTVTHRRVPGFPTPFAVVLVELEEQPGLRVVSNLVGVTPEEIRIDMPVEVTFEEHGEAVLPLFRPRGRPRAAGEAAARGDRA